MLARQLDLLSAPEPGFPTLPEARRIALAEDAWLDLVPGCVAGHDALFDQLERGTRWRSERRPMYDRMVDVPRLIARVPDDGPGHPLLEDLRAALSARYGEAFVRVTLALYRDGRDSVAYHGDTTARDMPSSVMATLSLGARRKFMLRPATGGAARSLMLGGGDLLVMGGTVQRTWRHGVPKVAEAAPRMAVMFRPAWGD